MNVFMAGMTHNQDQISAFVSWTNFDDILFTIGMSFSVFARTTVSNYVGQERFVQAKNSQKFYTFLICVMGLIGYLYIKFFKHSIIATYTELPAVYFWLEKCFDIYSIGSFAEITTTILSTTMRIANRTTETIYIAGFCYVIQ